jgi:hypothetical protein
MTPLIPNHAILVTASDTVNLPCASSYLSFTNSGVQTIHLTMEGGEDITITALPSGMYALRASRVWSTGTTVTNIVAYWT